MDNINFELLAKEILKHSKNIQQTLNLCKRPKKAPHIVILTGGTANYIEKIVNAIEFGYKYP